MFESIKQGLEEAIEITMTEEKLNLYKKIWSIPLGPEEVNMKKEHKEVPLGEDCSACACATCVFDCQECVHREDWLPDCRLFLVPDCPWYMTAEELDKLLDE